MQIRLDGATRLFGIVGDPITQSLSPATITPMLQEAGVNAVLVPLHVPAGRFDEVMRGLKLLHNFHGTMVTYPFKAQAVAFVDRLLPNGKLVGAINAMRREADGSWTGDAFDGQGLVAGLRGEKIALEGRRALLLGAGGAGTAIAFSLAAAGMAGLDIFDTETAKAQDVVSRIRAAFPGCAAKLATPQVAGQDLIINATPIGMQAGDPLPMELPGDLSGLPSRPAVVDIVPRDGSAFLAEAQRLGCQTINFRIMAMGQYREITRFFGTP